MPELKGGKRWIEAREKVDVTSRYSIDDAIQLIKETATAKFDETVDIAVRLGVNPRQADQMVRGAVSLPHGVGKTIRVLVFAEGDAARAAEEAGADFVGSDDLVAKIQEGWVEFDNAVAVRDMMPKVGRLGRVLGPRGLMPNPKSGTVVGPDQVGDIVTALKAGRLEFRVERAGIIHSPVGKASMGNKQLRENIIALMSKLVSLRPHSAKGQYVRSIYVSNTMGPGIPIDPTEAVRAAGGEIR